MNIEDGDRAVCWICDYGHFVLLVLFLLGAGIWRFQNFQYTLIDVPQIGTARPPKSTPDPTNLATITPGFLTANPEVSQEITPTATMLRPVASATPQKPEFVLVFVPVNWTSGKQSFKMASQMQAENFFRESGIKNYFLSKVVSLDEGLTDASLSSETLTDDIMEFGLQQQAGDRYIGLTDGDLAINGDSSIVGWTSGGQSVVAESADPFVAAHELGHTYGLCDEYSYTEWKRQDTEATAGCPNPYPPRCPKIENPDVLCEGDPTKDGRNSIMGPAGLIGDYGFNLASYNHLENYFKGLVAP